ncbi:hypothetical protein GCM10010294_30570 [Streptomyces griseoloalbus]|nr:hypothetical protein GCM10010294_30570 [Streptomyces griseoloalbus]
MVDAGFDEAVGGGRDAVDIRLHDDRMEGLVDAGPTFQKAGREAPDAQLSEDWGAGGGEGADGLARGVTRQPDRPPPRQGHRRPAPEKKAAESGPRGW